MLHQLVSPGKPSSLAQAGGQPAMGGNPDEAESLLRVLQEAAQQRAAAESALRSPSPRSGSGADGDPGRASWGEADIFSFFKALDAAGAASAPQPQRAPAHSKDQAAHPPEHRVSRDTHGGAAPDQHTTRRPHQPQDEAQRGEVSREDAAAASLQRSVHELEARRNELLVQLEDVSSQVSSSTVELEALRTQVAAVRAELAAQQSHLQAVHAQRQAADQSLQGKLDQLRQLDGLIQASTTQLTELEANLAAANAAAGSAAAAAAPAEAAEPAGGVDGAHGGRAALRGQRFKRRVKRHLATVRRSHSCSDLAAAAAATAAGAQQASGAHGPQEGTAAGGEGAAGTGASPARGPALPTPADAEPAYSPAKAQLQQLRKELLAITSEHSKAVLQLEQERHAGVAQQCELAALRQTLRSHKSLTITTSFEGGSGASASSTASAGPGGSTIALARGGAGTKRPLSVSVSGMEELLEEAAADLEQLEGHVSSVTQRLLGLQGQNLELAQQVAAALRRRAEAEAQAGEELRRAQALRVEVDGLQRSIAADQQASGQMAAQLAAARTELLQLEVQVARQREDLQKGRAAQQATEAAALEAEQRRLQSVHAWETAEQSRKAAEHVLQQLQQDLQQAESRMKQAEADAEAARQEAGGLSTAAEQARRDAAEAELACSRFRMEAAHAREELEAVRAEVSALQAQRVQEDEASQAARKQRSEAEGLLQACTAELERSRAELQQAQAAVQEAQAHLSGLRQQQQELTSTAEWHEQQAAAAERAAAAAQRELDTAREQAAAARQQLAELTAQVAAVRDVAAAAGLGAAGQGRGGASGTPSMQATPASGLGFAPPAGAPMAAMHPAAAAHYGAGLAAMPALEMSGSFMSMGGAAHAFTAQQHLSTVVQLQGEIERLQVAAVQAQSRQRMAEQRAVDAEQMCSELQARLSSLRAQQQHTALRAADLEGAAAAAAAVHAHQPASTTANAAVHTWRLKAEEVQQELDASQQMLGRYKTRLAAAQEECAGLEESLQREKAAGARLRQQVEALQREVATAPTGLPAASGSVAQQGSGRGKTTDARPVEDADAQVAAAKQELRKLQTQVSRQQELHSELLEEQAGLRRQGAALRQQMEEAAGQLIALKAQYEKGKLKVEQLKAQQASLQGRIDSLSAKEQAAQARVEELHRRQQQQEQLGATATSATTPAAAATPQHGAAPDGDTSLGLHAQLQAAQKELLAAKAERDALEKALTEALAKHAAMVVDAAAGAEQVALLQHQLQAAKQAAASSEEALAGERRWLQQCRAELAASQDAASRQRLQQDIEQLQAQVQELRAAKAAPAEAPAALVAAAKAGAASAQGSPLQREGALVPHTNHEANTPAARALVVGIEQSPVPAVWEATPTELADARRELHALQLRIAVACADEARVTAACAELRRQQATVEQDVSTRRQQVAEMEQRLGALQLRAAQGAKEEEVAAEMAELRDRVRAAQQAARTSEVALAEAQHLASLAGMRLSHAEEQLKLQQQQAAAQLEALAARLAESQSAAEQERQRSQGLAQQLQEAAEQLRLQAADHAAALRARLQEQAEALQVQAQLHAAAVSRLELEAESARADERTAAEVLVSQRARVDELQAEAVALAAQVAEGSGREQQLAQELEQTQLLLAATEARARKVEAEAASLSEHVAQLQAQGAADSQQLQQLRGEVAVLQASLQEAVSARAEAEEQVAVSGAAAAAARQDLAALHEQMEQLRGELSATIEQRNGEGAAREQAQEAASAASVAAASAEQEASTLRDQCEDLKQELAAAQAQAHDAVQQLQSVAADLEERLRAEQELVAALQQQAAASAAELAAATAMAAQLESELATARAEVAVAGERLQQLEVAANQEAVDNDIRALADHLAAELHAARGNWAQEVDTRRGVIAERDVQVAQLQAELEAVSQELLLQAANGANPDLAEADQGEDDGAAASPRTPVAAAAHDEQQLQEAALQQLVADCAALREQRDAALAQLAAAAGALDVAEAGTRELMLDKEQLEAYTAQLQQLLLDALQVVDQQQQQTSLPQEPAAGVSPQLVLPLLAAALLAGRMSAESSDGATHAAEAAQEASGPRFGADTCDQLSQTEWTGPACHAAESQTANDTDNSATQTEAARSAHPTDQRDRGVVSASPSQAEGDGGQLRAVHETPQAAQPQQLPPQHDADSYTQLLHVLADRAALQQHVAILQAQLDAATRDRSELERQAGSLEAQLEQLQCDQEQQLVLMHIQIEALRGQLMAWRADVEADAGAAAVTAQLAAAVSQQRQQQQQPSMSGADEAEVTAAVLITPMGKGASACAATQTSRSVTPAVAAAAVLATPVHTAAAGTPFTPASAASPAVSVSAALAAALGGASPLDVARLQGQVVELTSRLQRAQREAAEAEEKAEAAWQQRVAEVEAEAADLSQELCNVQGQEEGARAQLQAALQAQAALGELLTAAQEQLANAAPLKPDSADKGVATDAASHCSVGAQSDAVERPRDCCDREAQTDAESVAGAVADTQTEWPLAATASTSTQTSQRTTVLFGAEAVSIAAAASAAVTADAGTQSQTVGELEAEFTQGLRQQLERLQGQQQAEAARAEAAEAQVQQRRMELSDAAEKAAAAEAQLLTLRERCQQLGAELEEQRLGEMARLQSVQAEFEQLEQQLKVELRRAEAAAEQAEASLRTCQQELAAVREQARQALQEALRATQQAATFQTQLAALRQRNTSTTAPSALGPPTLSSHGAGDKHQQQHLRRASADSVWIGERSGSSGSAASPALRVEASLASWSQPGAPPAAERKATMAAAPAAQHPPQSQPELTAQQQAQPPEAKEAQQPVPPPQAGQELAALQRHCGELERQTAAQREELARLRSRLAASEARLATASQQLAALNAELRSHDAAELDAHTQLQQRVDEEARLRVAQQAAEDARLLLAVKGQLAQCREELAGREAELAAALQELAAARAAAEAAAAELEGVRREAAGLKSELEQLRHQPGQHEAMRSDGAASDGGATDRAAPEAPAAGRLPALDGADERAVDAVVQRVMAALMGSLRQGAVPGGVEAASDGEASPPRRAVYSRAGSDGDASEAPAVTTGRLSSLREQQLVRRLTRPALLQAGLHPAADASDSEEGERGSAGAGCSDGAASQEEGSGAELSVRSGSYLGRLQEFWTSDAEMEALAPSYSPRFARLHAHLRRSRDSGCSGYRGGRPRLPALRAGGGRTGIPLSRRPLASSACQTEFPAELTPVAAPGTGEPLPRVTVAAAANLADLQRQQAALLAQVSALRCQAAEADALSAARAGHIAELQLREQQLSAAVDMLRRQAQTAMADMQCSIQQCQAVGEKALEALEADCRQLQEARTGAVAELEQTRALLAGTVRALRLGRASLQSRKAVDDALAGLAASAAADNGVSGPQAMHHVRVVFSCMSELCGRAEALSTALLPVAAQLSAAAQPPRTADGDAHCTAAAAVVPVAVVAAAHAATAKAAATATATEVGAVGAGAASEAAVSAAAAARLQAELRRVHGQLHERARKYAGVLKAVVAGKQLPAERLLEGFQRLWAASEEQLGRLANMPLLPAAVAEVSGGGGGAGSQARADAPRAPSPAEHLPGGSSAAAGAQPAAATAASEPLTAAAADRRPPSRARVPLAAVENQVLQALPNGADRHAGTAAARPLLTSPKRGAPTSPRDEGGAAGRHAPRRRQLRQEDDAAHAVQTNLSAWDKGEEGDGEEAQRDRLQSQLQHVLGLAKRLQSRGPA
ncbi:hypothetical protein HXX76_003933 [Chlamydomonas incerta]|uniref:Uncharacterized protein n=1 Tax=Chlamydomonas incerta TaxID=51695 RepID=A0A835TNL5_CHLIN|nr:hypothetical protein HXX76_003933 [Chlamydomonas incerta]|eukprot:KAG2441080.1 hypothetical protein HXX76_003933 [Chlamydomonas incerta]